MANYSFNTTAAQENILTAIRDNVNIERVAAELPPFADNNAMVLARMVEMVQSWKRHLEALDLVRVQEAYHAASNATQNQVRTTLGV